MTEVYIDFNPNSLPNKIIPTTSNDTFITNVISDTANGIRFDNTIARPEILLTAAWLGTKKKNTAHAIIKIATVNIKISFTSSNFFNLHSSIHLSLIRVRLYHPYTTFTIQFSMYKIQNSHFSSKEYI